jgi:hypothetical protein
MQATQPGRSTDRQQAPAKIEANVDEREVHRISGLKPNRDNSIERGRKSWRLVKTAAEASFSDHWSFAALR